MPVVLKENIEGSTLLLWEITESEQELRAMVTRADLLSAGRFTAANRRKEHLAWRAALRQAGLKGTVEYNAAGAPFIAGDDGAATYISAAHTAGMAAVMVSGRRCAVDIEALGRDMSRTASRFITAAESGLPDNGLPEFPVAVWCAKEALYKYSGRRELDFLRDLAVTSTAIAAGQMTGRICGGPELPILLVRFGAYIAACIA